MDRKEVFDWARTLERSAADLDPMALCWLVDEMLAGRYGYDKYAGIQQLTLGLRMVEKTGNGYRFKVEENFPG